MIINFYAECINQVDHDKIRYEYFNPITICRTIYIIKEDLTACKN